MGKENVFLAFGRADIESGELGVRDEILGVTFQRAGRVERPSREACEWPLSDNLFS